MKKFFYTLLLLFVANFCSAADLTGHWTGSINGQFDIACDFKVDGDKVTGSMTGPQGPMAISDGILKGNDLSFNIDIMGNLSKVKGKLVGEVLTLSFSVGGNDISFDLKKSGTSPTTSTATTNDKGNSSILGHWAGRINDQIDLAYDFKAEGEKITGTMTGPDGTPVPISDIVVNGNAMTFNLDIMGNKTAAKGKLNGELLTISFGFQDRDITIDLKKTK
nr:hypothetical protein [uncultured Mucilaginibacter sp.]